ncbi:hypothetical protein [Paraburkholderia sacchari]|uniref:hypothetical protein n=1 Tax=Paraburkholderia sacchari TaxID=159450 RepID=UPI001BCF5111|nr:hypothetical protein [Paraburkholderia sacchari]
MENADRLAADLAAARMTQAPYATDRSAVSWPAIVAGAFGMAAFSLVLLTLDTGLGLSSLSPWPGTDAQAKAFGFAAII